jgi:AcrR family transcriptional regulator
MVSVDRTSAHLVGDEESSKRRQILDGARKVFLDLGFDGASMGDIARAAGVSKGTLYVYFADKCRLFEAIVEDEALERRQLAFYFDPACDIKTTLRRFGEAYIGMLCRPGGGSAARMVFAIAERMPEIGRRYYELVLQKTVNRLAEYLDGRVKQRELMSARGHAIHAHVPSFAVSALHLPGGAGPIPGAYHAGSQRRGTDVSRGKCCEGNLNAGAVYLGTRSQHDAVVSARRFAPTYSFCETPELNASKDYVRVWHL